MMHVLLYVALVAAAVFFTGLLIYTFYIVLTSNSVPLEKHSDMPEDKTARPANKQPQVTPLPDSGTDKPGSPRKPHRRRAA